MSTVALLCMLLGGVLPVAAATPVLSTATTMAEADLIDISTLVPDIALDMRYAGNDNFVGQPIDGYEAARCLLKSQVARALARVERGLRETDMRLKLFDCYRPARAVRQFVEWAADTDAQETRALYYPRLDKRDLLGAYIAPISGHSRGATVDLTLLHCKDHGGSAKPGHGHRIRFSMCAQTPIRWKSLGATREPATFASRHAAGRIPQLRNGMVDFTYQPEPSPGTIYDIPIQ